MCVLTRTLAEQIGNWGRGVGMDLVCREYKYINGWCGVVVYIVSLLYSFVFGQLQEILV